MFVSLMVAYRCPAPGDPLFTLAVRLPTVHLAGAEEVLGPPLAGALDAPARLGAGGDGKAETGALAGELAGVPAGVLGLVLAVVLSLAEGPSVDLVGVDPPQAVSARPRDTAAHVPRTALPVTFT